MAYHHQQRSLREERQQMHIRKLGERRKDRMLQECQREAEMSRQLKELRATERALKQEIRAVENSELLDYLEKD